MSIQGFYAQKEEKRKGGKEEMGKTTISEGIQQIKGILFSKNTKPGCNYYLTAQSWKVSSNWQPVLSLKGGGRTIRSAKAGGHIDWKMEARPCNRRHSPLQTRTLDWASVPTLLSKTCFPFACSKVCIRSHEAQTIRQQHDTINQNQTSKRVFVGTSKLCNVPQRVKQPKRLTVAIWGVGGGKEKNPSVHKRVHTKWHFTI